MTEHKYLDNHEKAKSACVCIGLAAAALLVIGALTANVGHAVLPNLLLTLGVAAILALVCFVIHYIRHNEYDDAGVKGTVSVLHLYAAEAIFTAAALYSGGFGTFSYAVVHAVCDGFLAALLMLSTFVLLGKRGGAIAAIAGVAAAALSLLEVTLAVNILLAVLGAVLFVVALVRAKYNSLSVLCLLVALVSAVFAVLALFAVGGAIHMYLHFAVLVCGLAPVCAVFAIAARNSVKLYTGNGKSAGAQEKTYMPKENAAEYGEHSVKPEHEKKTVSDSAANDGTDTLEQDKWVVKRFRGLSAGELLLAPVDALNGVSAGDAQLLKEAFGVKTIGELADNKYFAWAAQIVAEADGK